MAHSIISSVHSVLDDLATLQESCPDDLMQCRFVVLRHRLRNLKTFLLCTQKLGNDARLRAEENDDSRDQSLGSFLSRIGEAVSQNSLKIQTYCLRLEDGFCMDVMDVVGQFQNDVEYFHKEIDEWYVTMSGYSHQSTSPTMVLEIIDSVLENLVEFLIMPIHNDSVIGLIEDLGEKIKLLRSFIPFATKQGVDSQHFQDLLAHIEAVALGTAHLTAHHTLTMSYMYHMVFGEKWWEGMPEEISELMERIKPVNHRVCEIYTQALTTLKLSRQFHAPNLDFDDSSVIVMKDFIDFLLFNLWEILKLDACLVASLRDRMQVLYEGLRFLRTCLNEQPNRFTAEETKDLTRAVICDAGILIFSLYENHVGTDLPLDDLLERINLLKTGVNVPQTLTFSLPKTDQLGFIDFLLENLVDLVNGEAYLHAQSQLQSIHEDLVLLRSFLGEIAGFRKEQEELQVLWDRTMEAAYKVECLIDQLVRGDTRESFSTSFDSIINDMKIIRADSLKVFLGKRKEEQFSKATGSVSTHVRSQSSAPTNNEIVGFDAEVTSIIGRLTRGFKQLRVVSIVGMPGLGKTTLATKVFHNSSVMHHFQVHAWSTLSQEFNKKKVLIELLNDIVPGKFSGMDEHDLAAELRRRLKGRRYVIVLDDVWDMEAWNALEGSLPDDSNGSRIILTSRLRDVVPRALLGGEEPHFLRQLTNDESYELLQKKLFQGKGCPPSLSELGMRIADKCKGLPLSIIIVAGLLANIEPESWNEVLESLSPATISSTEQCMYTLELSYKQLPDYLKPCFIYFGAFPEDTVISVQRLFELWICEGFIRRTGSKTLEEVAADYLTDLIGRSLVMVFRMRSIGGVKACRVHDLLRDFCSVKAREENFVMLLRGYDELLASNQPCRRLCIYSTQKHFKESKLYCPHVHSLFFFDQTEWYESFSSLDISFILLGFKLLRVLNIRQINLGPVFPSEFELLVQLRYLSIQGEMDVIPLSFGSLSNLVTFILDSRGKTVSLPSTILKLQKLRHLYIRTDFAKFVGFTLPTENLDQYSPLKELQRFSGAIVSSWLSFEGQVRMFPNIRKLKCKVVEYDNVDPETCVNIMVPENLSRLESLNVSPFDVDKKHIDYEFSFPANLKKLTLSLFGLPWSKISTFGKLPNLEVLKLVNGAFSGEAWDMEEDEFANLKFLKLAGLDIVRWAASDDQFPNLEKLVLNGCFKLEEIPSCLETIPTLKAIEVSSCLECISGLVEQIQDMQTDLGNSDLEILISHVSRSS